MVTKKGKPLGRTLDDLTKAMRELTDDDGTPTPELLRRANSIASAYNLKQHVSLLASALAEAQYEYSASQAVRRKLDVGVGDKPNKAKSFLSTLRKADELLQDQGLLNRLTLAASRPQFKKTISQQQEDMALFDAAGIFTSLSHSQASLRGFIRLAEQAFELEGRAAGSQLRYDLRAAIPPLKRFWVDVAGRSPKPTCKAEQYNETADFLFDCLDDIDPKVTKRIVVAIG